MQSDDPAFLPVGTEVSAKFKGAFCEAKVKKADKKVKCKVALKEPPFGSLMLDDTGIKGNLVVNEIVEVLQGKQWLKAQIQSVKDCSTYTVVFNDGDVRELKRSGLVLKSGKHFDTAANLDTMPLYNPDTFVASLLGTRRGKVKRKTASRRTSDESEEDEEDEDEDPKQPSTSRVHNLRRSSSLTNVKAADKSMRPPADPVRKLRESSVIAARRIAETPTGSTDDEQEDNASRASGQRSITASPLAFLDRLKRTRQASGKLANSPSPLPKGRPKRATPKQTPTPSKVSSDEESDQETKRTSRRTRLQVKSIPQESDSEVEEKPTPEKPTSEKTMPKKVSPKMATRSSSSLDTAPVGTPVHHATRSSAHKNSSTNVEEDEKEPKLKTQNLFATPKKEPKETKEAKESKEAKEKHEYDPKNEAKNPKETPKVTHSKEPQSPTKKTPPSPIKKEARSMSSSSEASKVSTVTPSNVFSKALERGDSPTKSVVAEKKVHYDVGNVVLVHEYANPPSGRFYPAIIVAQKAYQANAKNAINIEKNCVPLRSFRNSKYLTSDLKHLTPFEASSFEKLEDVVPSLQAAFDKANKFHTKKRLPGDWDIPSIYGPGVKKIPEAPKKPVAQKDTKKIEEKPKNGDKSKEKDQKETGKKDSDKKDSEKKEKDTEKVDKVEEEKVKEKEKPKDKEKDVKAKEDKKEKEHKNTDKDEKEKDEDKTDDSASDESLSEDENSEEYNEKRDRFVAHFYKFQDESGNPMNRVPILGGKEIDLYRFYDVVTRMGGHRYVTQKQLWKKVLLKLKLENCPGANNQTVKQSYQRYFSRFEDFMKQLGYGLLNEGVGASSSSRNRSTRILEFDWRKNVKEAREKRAKEREAKEKSKDKEKSPSESSESKAPSVKSTATTTSMTPSLTSSRNELLSSMTPDVHSEEGANKKEKSPEKGLKDVKTEPGTEKKPSTLSKQGSEKLKSDKPKIPRERGPKRERRDSSSAIGSSDEEARKRYRKKRTDTDVNDSRVRSPSTYSKSALESDVGYSNAHIFTRFYQGQKVHARHDSRFYDARVVTVKQPSLKDIAKTLMNAYQIGKMTHSNYPNVEDITLQNLSIELKDVLKNLMNETKIFVHYLGWNSRYDEWLMLHMIRVDEKDEKNSTKAVQELMPHELPPKLFAAAMDWCASPDGIQSLATIHAYSGEHQRPRRLSSSSTASVGHHRHQSTHSQSGAVPTSSSTTAQVSQQILVASPSQTMPLVSPTGVQVIGSPPQGGTTTVIYQVPTGQSGGPTQQVVGIGSNQQTIPGQQPIRTATPVAISIQPQTGQGTPNQGSFSPAYQSPLAKQQSPRYERPPSAHSLPPPQPSASTTVVLATPVSVTPIPRASTPGQASLGGSSPASVTSTKFAVPPNVTVGRGIGSPLLVAPAEFTHPSSASTASTAPMLESPHSEHGVVTPTPSITTSPKSKSDVPSTPIQQTSVELTIVSKDKHEDVKAADKTENVATVKESGEVSTEKETIEKKTAEGTTSIKEKTSVTKEGKESVTVESTTSEVVEEKEAKEEPTGSHLAEDLDEIEIAIERTSYKDEQDECESVTAGRSSVASSTKTLGSPATSTPRGGWGRKRPGRHFGPPAGLGDRKHARADTTLSSPRVGGETPRGAVEDEAETSESSEFEDIVPRDSTNAVKHRVMQKMEAENLFDNYDFLGLSNLELGDDCDSNVELIEERMRALKEIYQSTRLKLQTLEKKWKKSNEKRKQREREARHSKDAQSLKSPSTTSVTGSEEVTSTTA